MTHFWLPFGNMAKLAIDMDLSRKVQKYGNKYVFIWIHKGTSSDYEVGKEKWWTNKFFSSAVRNVRKMNRQKRKIKFDHKNVILRLFPFDRAPLLHCIGCKLQVHIRLDLPHRTCAPRWHVINVHCVSTVRHTRSNVLYLLRNAIINVNNK